MTVQQFYNQDHQFFISKNCGHTAAEIAQQPAMWRKLDTYMQEMAQTIRNYMAGVAPNARVILTGAGSSGFVGRAVAGYAAQGTGKNCEAIHTTDLVSAPQMYLFENTPTLLISFARSGNSPESVGAVEYARRTVKNLWEIAIVCDGGSKLAGLTRESKNGLLLVMPEGTNDNGFAMTSSVSTMILAGCAVLSGGKTIDIPALCEAVEKNANSYVKLAEECASWGSERAWYLGSGPLQALVQEGALKMMELTNGAVVAGHNSATEFRHGPKTVMNPKTVTVHFISPNKFTAKYDIDLLNELYLQKTSNKIVAIQSGDENADLSVPYAAMSEVAAGIQGLVFMQLLSMFTSLKLGVPTDNPSPSGLVNRVVQGVTVYPI